jgi:hypothetical protein
MLEIDVGFLCLSNLWCGKRKDLLFLATICEHLVKIAFLHLIAWVVFIVTMPDFEKVFHFTMVFFFADILKAAWSHLLVGSTA